MRELEASTVADNAGTDSFKFSEPLDDLTFALCHDRHNVALEGCCGCGG